MTEPKHDRWGRYVLPDPVTGEKRPWTRATTWANSVQDTYGLTAWKMRMVAKGVAIRRDLTALANSLPLDAKKQLDKLAQQALEAAGGSSGANLGTALHGFTEQVDRGETPEIPEPWDRDIAAYTAALKAMGIITVRELIERVVVCSELGVAGTLDRIVLYEDRWYIADVKTGADLSYSWGEIAIQLALYANADAMWTGEDYESMPPVSREQALVIHLPVGKARCELHWVDIAAGWETARLCGAVREWRGRKDLARPFDTDDDTLFDRLEQSVEQTSPAAESEPDTSLDELDAAPQTVPADSPSPPRDAETAGAGDPQEVLGG